MICRILTLEELLYELILVESATWLLRRMRSSTHAEGRHRHCLDLEQKHSTLAKTGEICKDVLHVFADLYGLGLISSSETQRKMESPERKTELFFPHPKETSYTTIGTFHLICLPHKDE